MAEPKVLSLQEEYDLIMRKPFEDVKTPTIQLSWEKSGDIFKQFSIFDYSKYSTSTKSNVNDEKPEGVLCQAGMKY